jgi:hypothetical protein
MLAKAWTRSSVALSGFYCSAHQSRSASEAARNVRTKLPRLGASRSATSAMQAALCSTADSRFIIHSRRYASLNCAEKNAARMSTTILASTQDCRNVLRRPRRSTLVTSSVAELRYTVPARRLHKATDMVASWICLYRPQVVVIERTSRHPKPGLQQVHRFALGVRRLSAARRSCRDLR